MTKQVTLTRDNQTIIVGIRQMAHDKPAIVGKKLKHGTGKAWTVVKVEVPGNFVDERGVEYSTCCICGDEVNTHYDSGNPLAFCGGCGRATCPDHRDESLATLCSECSAKQKAAN